MVERQSIDKDNLIEVLTDETPAVLTAVISESSSSGRRRLLTAVGELADANMVEMLSDDPTQQIRSIRVTALADQTRVMTLRNKSGLSLYM